MKRNIIKFSFILFVSLNFSGNLFAKDIQIPSVNETFLINHSDGKTVADEKFTGEQIIKYALAFSLCKENSDSWKKAITKFNELEKAIKKNKIQNLDEMQRAEKLNEFMYQNCLTHYSSNQSKIDEMLIKGKYNCVSSSLLYLALAMDFNIDARVQETPHHAFISVYMKDGTKIDVETTNPYGFNPGTKKLLEENANGTQKYAVIPKTHYSNRNEISHRRAISLVGKNLCSSFNEKNDFVQGVPLAAACYTFVQKEKSTSRKDFDTLTTNFAIYAEKNKQTEQGLDFLDKIIQKYGSSDYLTSQYSILAFNSSATNCNGKNYTAARKNFEKHKSNIDPKTRLDIEKMILEGEIVSTVNKLSGDEGIKYIKEVKHNPAIQENKTLIANLNKMEESFWIQKIQKLSNEEKYLEAATMCDKALQDFPKSENLKSVKKTCMTNHGISIHNKLVPLINSKKYPEALKILNAALKENPDDPLLKKDQKLLKQVK